MLLKSEKQAIMKEYARFEELPYTQPADVRKRSPIGARKEVKKMHAAVANAAAAECIPK